MKKFLLVLFLLPTIVFGRKFYFSSSTGNDSYTSTQAQNQATPWKTLQKLQKSVTSGAAIFLPGDTICFKRGDVFANGYVNGFSTMQWANDGGAFFTAPSGTPSAPIVITNYGSTSLPLPNWLHPSTTYPVSTWKNREGRGIVYFAGVHDIVIDGIQSNDFRFPESDKANPGYSGGWVLGEWTRGTSGGLRNSYVDSTRRRYMVTRFVVKNCVFNNTIYGIQAFAGIDCKITNNTFTNFKSSADTAGINDIMAGAIEGVNGIRCEFSYNYIKGAWGKGGRVSSSNGLGGVAFDMFNLYNSRICYNTIIDCNGAFEIGNLDRYDSLAGFQYDTIAFNKVINSSQLSYLHGTGFFAGNNHHMAYWNNVCISNPKERNSGNGFGQDIYGDGQGWRPGTTQPWWFCRNPYSIFNPPNYPLRPTVTTTAGSNVITVSNAAGISVGAVFFVDNDTLLGVNYQTVTVTGISGTSLSLSVPATATRTNLILSTADRSGFYLPVADPSWSNPSNPAYNNYSGHRSVIQYATDATIYGSYIDTMIDSRNNILYWTTGTQGLYDRNRFKRSSNIYIPLGTARYASSLGGTLNYRGTGELQSNGSNMFVDTSAAFPESWDLHLKTGSVAIGAGKPISGFTTDFAGNALTNPPSIGLYNYSVPSSAATTPVITTSSAIIASGTSATLGGNVTSTGGATVYRRGVVYSTGAITDTTSITGGSKLVASTTGLGTYTIPSGTLVRGTTYYAKAFALNSAGVSYGAQISFTTLNIPTIATVTPTAITQTTAVSGGVISTDGNSAIIKRGLIYSRTAITDTSNGTKIVATTASTGAFSTNLSGLSPNTLYNVRAYAYNSVGIAYGSNLTFTTSGQIISPITVSVTATPIVCNGDTSIVVVSASGGTPPYTATGTFERVAGTYTFSVTDGFANSGSQTITISQPTLIVPTLTFPPVTTVGGTTTVTVASTGGTGTKSYAIDGGAYQSGLTFAGITAGAHTLYVTDANACIVEKAFTVNTTSEPTKSALKFKN